MLFRSPVVDRGHLLALAAGDDAAWQTTVRRYEGLLRSAARVVLRSVPRALTVFV